MLFEPRMSFCVCDTDHDDRQQDDGEHCGCDDCVCHISIVPDCSCVVNLVFQSFSVHMRPVGRCSRGTGFSFFRTLVAVQHVGDEILVHVHVVVHGNCCKSRVTQNPADFSDLGSLIRQALFHLVRDCLWVVAHNFFLLIVSHAPIISDRRRLVKPDQGFSLLPIYIIGIFRPSSPPIRERITKFLKVVVSRWHQRGYIGGGPRPPHFFLPTTGLVRLRPAPRRQAYTVSLGCPSNPQASKNRVLSNRGLSFS
jgi:hypothetical protein